MALVGFLLASAWGAVIFWALYEAAKDELGSLGFSGIQLKWGLWVYFFGGIVGLVLAFVDLFRGGEGRTTGSFAGHQPNPIVIHNHSNAQIGSEADV